MVDLKRVAIRVAESPRIALFLATLAVGVGAAVSPIWRDGDVFWHLAVGRELWQTGALVRTETFSFTALGAHWADVEWLFHLFCYPYWSWAGQTGAVALISLCAVGSVVIIFASMRAEKSGFVTFTLWTGVLFPALLSRYRFRPELFSLLLFAFLVYCLWRWRSLEVLRLRQALVVFVLFLVWGQIHGGWSYGALLLASFSVDSLMYAKPGLPTFWVRFGGLACFFGAALCGAALNPFFPDSLFFPLRSFIGLWGDMPSVEEWGKTPWGVGTWPMLVAAISLFGVELISFAKSRKSRHDLTWTFSQALLVLFWWRYGSFAWLALAPVAARQMAALFHSKEVRQIATLGALSLLLLRVGIAVPDIHLARTQAMSLFYPVEETRFLKEHAVNVRLLHDYGVGGYLSWALPVTGKIFMDGRYFPFLQAIQLYQKALDTPALMDDLLDKYAINVVLVPHYGSGLGRFSCAPENRIAFSRNRWAPVFIGPYSTVYVRRSPQTASLVANYEYHYLLDEPPALLLSACRSRDIPCEQLAAEMKRATLESQSHLPCFLEALTSAPEVRAEFQGDNR